MHPSVMTLAICALATFRVTRLVAIEDGPFALALRLRGLLDPDQRTWVGRGMACPWCISFWIAPLLLYAATDDIGYLLVSGLAVSALVGIGYSACGYTLAIAERLMRRGR